MKDPIQARLFNRGHVHWSDYLLGMFFSPAKTLNYISKNPVFGLPHIVFLILIMSCFVFLIMLPGLTDTHETENIEGRKVAFILIIGGYLYFKWLVSSIYAWIILYEFKIKCRLECIAGTLGHAYMVPMIWLQSILVVFGGLLMLAIIIKSDLMAIAIFYLSLLLGLLGGSAITLIWYFFFFKGFGLNSPKSILATAILAAVEILSGIIYFSIFF